MITAEGKKNLTEIQSVNNSIFPIENKVKVSYEDFNIFSCMNEMQLFIIKVASELRKYDEKKPMVLEHMLRKWIENKIGSAENRRDSATLQARSELIEKICEATGKICDSGKGEIDALFATLGKITTIYGKQKILDLNFDASIKDMNSELWMKNYDTYFATSQKNTEKAREMMQELVNLSQQINKLYHEASSSVRY